jgi:hypothetical protein
MSLHYIIQSHKAVIDVGRACALAMSVLWRSKKKFSLELSLITMTARSLLASNTAREARHKASASARESSKDGQLIGQSTS